MRIGLLYVAAGHGHKKAAEALKEALLNQNPSLEIELQDVTNFGTALLKKTYIPSYDLLAVHHPLVWGFFFYLSNVRILRPLASLLRIIFNSLHLKRFNEWVLQNRCDIYVSTHFMPAEILGRLKRNGKINSKLVTLVTDYRVHQFWVNRGTDFYTTMTEDAKSDIIKLGGEASSISIRGIPIFSKFALSYSKNEMRKKLGLNENQFTIVITTGSFGSGPIGEILTQIDQTPGLQAIVVCAQNKSLFESLQKQTFKNKVLVLGYVNNMEELMAASDAIIAKPGGLTSCEALAQNILLILTSPIPGQEEGNREYLLRHQCAFSLNHPLDLKNILNTIQNDSRKIQEMKKHIREIRKPNSAKEIAQWIQTLK